MVPPSSSPFQPPPEHHERERKISPATRAPRASSRVLPCSDLRLRLSLKPAAATKMSQSLSSGADERAPRCDMVETVFPSAAAAAEAEEQIGGAPAPAIAEGTAAPSCGSGNASAIDDVDSLIAKALEKLPPELSALAKDPKRHAKSKDPGWKYGFWCYEGKRDMVQCIFCKKVVPAGIRRFKQHLAGGYGDAEKCPSTPAIVRKEMDQYLKKNGRTQVPEGEGGAEAESEGEVGNTCCSSSAKFRTKFKDAKRKAQASIASYMSSAKPGSQKYSKSVSSMLCKTPEEVVHEKHNSKTSQPSMEHCTKKSMEAKQIVDDHVADFFYENGIPLNAVDSRSWEILLESIGQYVLATDHLHIMK